MKICQVVRAALLALFLGAASAHAQNVGVGVSSPPSKLTVNRHDKSGEALVPPGQKPRHAIISRSVISYREIRLPLPETVITLATERFL